MNDERTIESIALSLAKLEVMLVLKGFEKATVHELVINAVDAYIRDPAEGKLEFLALFGMLKGQAS
jgi:hypothetical protein